ncbi:hypothetical protein HanRHA438_Chr03g0134381 [Helianthus annuus]|nr:hypothetical protein HanRHA438_Chr03g0134381 [Helianthus annuus]
MRWWCCSIHQSLLPCDPVQHLLQFLAKMTIPDHHKHIMIRYNIISIKLDVYVCVYIYVCVLYTNSMKLKVCVCVYIHICVCIIYKFNETGSMYVCVYI